MNARLQLIRELTKILAIDNGRFQSTEEDRQEALNIIHQVGEATVREMIIVWYQHYRLNGASYSRFKIGKR